MKYLKLNLTKYNIIFIILSIIFVVISIIIFFQKNFVTLNLEEQGEKYWKIYYRSKNNSFSENRIVIAQHNKNKVLFNLNSNNIKYLRFDLPEINNLEIRIKSIEFNLRILKHDISYYKILSKDIKKNISLTNDISLLNYDNDSDSFKIITKGTDPYFVINNKLYDFFIILNLLSLFRLIFLAFLVFYFFKVIIKNKKIHGFYLYLYSFIYTNKYRKVFFIFILLNILTLPFYYRAFFHNQKISPSSLMYLNAPWNSIQDIKVSGNVLSDPIDAIIPSVFHVKDSLIKYKELPLWNKNNALGAPNIENVLNAIVSPFNWVYFILPFEYGLYFNSYLKIFLSLLSMFVLLGTITKFDSIKFFGASVYAYSGPLIVWHLWPHAAVASISPLLFYYFFKLITKKSYKDFLIAIFLLIIMIFSGMLTYVAYFLYLLLFYSIFQMIKFNKLNLRAYKVNIFAFLFFFILVFLISLPYILSMINQVVDTGYATNRNYMYEMFFKPLYLESLFYFKSFPNFHQNEVAMYVGFIPILLSLLFIPFLKFKKEFIFWLIVASVLIVIIFSDILTPIIKILPIINSSRRLRLVILLVFSLSILSVFSLDFFLNFLLNKYNNQLCSMVIVLLIIINFYFIFSNKILDYNPTINIGKTNYPITSSINYLKNELNYYRFLAIDDWTLFPNTNLFYDIEDIRGHIFANTSNYSIKYFNNIDKKFYHSETRTRSLDINNYNLLRYASVKYILSTRLLNNPNVVLEKKTDDGIFINKINNVYSKFYLTDKVYYYQNEDIILEKMKTDELSKAAYILTDNDKTLDKKYDINESSIDILHYSNNKIILNVQNKNNCFLVISNRYDKGWNVTINSKKEKLLRTNFIFQGLQLEKGDNIVELFYYPNYFKFSILISITTILILFLFSFLYFIKKSKSNDYLSITSNNSEQK